MVDHAIHEVRCSSYRATITATFTRARIRSTTTITTTTTTAEAEVVGGEEHVLEWPLPVERPERSQ